MVECVCSVPSKKRWNRAVIAICEAKTAPGDHLIGTLRGEGGQRSEANTDARIATLVDYAPAEIIVLVRQVRCIGGLVTPVRRIKALICHSFGAVFTCCPGRFPCHGTWPDSYDSSFGLEQTSSRALQLPSTLTIVLLKDICGHQAVSGALGSKERGP
jgi:hypothetical protein